MAAPTAKEIRDKRLPLAKQINDLRDAIHKDNRDFNAEEKEKWAKVNKEYDELSIQLQYAERAEKVATDLGSVDPDRFDPRAADYDGKKARRQLEKQTRKEEREKERREYLKGAPTNEDQALGLQAWMRVQSGRSLKRQHELACERMKMKPSTLKRRDFPIQLSRNYEQVRRQFGPHVAQARAYAGNQETLDSWGKQAMEARALALNANVAGGYLVPEGFIPNLEIALLLYSNIRTVADVMRTNSGQDLPWPAANDTFNKGAILTENATVTQQDIVFGQLVLHAYKYTSKMILVPVELMEDSAFDLANVLGNLLGIRIGRIQNDHMTSGTGVAQPTGIQTAATQGVQAASATAIAWDDLYKLKHAVDPAYRTPALNVGWMFHDQILGFLKRLKDGAGRYLWQAGVSASVPDRIDGDPYTINQSMASTMASGNRTVLYGAMKKMKVRDVTQIRLRRLVERFADADQEAFVMFARFDASLLDAGTHPIQYLVH